MDLLMCGEEMMPETPEGAFVGPENMAEIEARNLLSVEMSNFINLDRSPFAFVDTVIQRDPRVLPFMLRMEEQLQMAIQPNYFKTMQPYITVEHRTNLVSWLFEVCEEERYIESAFLRAVSYIDRVLSVNTIKLDQLQLLGVTCLSLSLKYHGINFHVDKLLYYTANSVPKSMVMEWEIMVVYAINWDLATIVPSDFIQMFLPLINENWWTSTVASNVKTFLAYSYTDHSFIIHTPSIIAAASLTYAVGCSFSREVQEEALTRLHEITSIEMDMIRSVAEQLQMKISSNWENRLTPGLSDPGVANNNNNVTQYSTDEPMATDKIEEVGLAETPTDVGDVHF